MNKAQFFLAPLIIASLFLTGCISKQPEPVNIGTAMLTEENSLLQESPSKRFSLRLPDGLRLLLDQEEETASLYRILDEASATKMFFEENLTSVDNAIGLLLNLKEVTEVSQEEIEINGLPGKKVLVELSTAPGKIVPYYVLQGGKYAYVFSLVTGQEFEYYLPIVNSFQSNLAN